MHRLLIALLLASATASAQRPSPSHAAAAPARRQPREVARVNDVALLSDRLDAAVNALIPLESFHRGVTQAKLDELRGRALQQVINEELQYQDGVRLGVKVADTEVETAFAATVQRYGGAKGFEQALARAGASRASVRREIRRALVIERARSRRVLATCQVGQDGAARYFNEHPERFVEPERLHLYAITIGVDPSSSPDQRQAARAKAEGLHRQIAAGGSFESVARQHSTDPSRTTGGDMGFFHRGSLAPAFEDVARTLAPGQVSPVVETIYGFHLIRINEIHPSRRLRFDEVSTKLATELTDTRCKEATDAWLSRLRSTARITTSS